MTYRADIDKEREGLVLHADELRRLLMKEWRQMSWTVATERGRELLATEARIQAIDRTRAGRERKRRAK